MKHYKEWVLWVLIIAFGGIYLSLCFNNNIWTDEGYTIDLLRNCKTFQEVCNFTAEDVHPPLYYLILKIFTDRFGIHLLLIKILSIVPMFLTMVLGATVIRKEFGFRTALFFILTMGTLPCTMEYAVQARMYTWAIFFVTLCGLEAYRTATQGKLIGWLSVGRCWCSIHALLCFCCSTMDLRLFVFIPVNPEKKAVTEVAGHSTLITGHLSSLADENVCPDKRCIRKLLDSGD